MAEPARKERRDRGTRTSDRKRAGSRMRAPAHEPQGGEVSPASVSALTLAAKRLQSWVQALDNYHRSSPDENPVPGFIRESLAQLEQLRDARASLGTRAPAQSDPRHADAGDADADDAESSWGKEEPGRYIDGRWVVNPKWIARG